LVSNPSEREMEDLVQKAHINILPGFNKNVTGVRIKLLHALYKGRHCVTTPAMVEGTGLKDACHIGTTANAIASIISQLYYLPFEEEEVKLRKRLLEDTYNNDKNIGQFIDYLW
ncbi:MAG TPA: mannosyltransferase, partial [Niabella sp.]|nr:mannosyltransferase [Niabella sp.]